MNLYKFVSNSLNKKLGFVANLEIPKNREFGDFSTNAAMVMAKSAGKNPREFAGELLPKISELNFVSDASIAGPGFINIKLKNDFIWESVNQKSDIKNQNPYIIDMDYGAYNVAKSLHIGHLRTSIVGDTLNRIAKFLGHKTISYNHIGDWGRPMGLVIAYIESLHPDWPFFQDNFDLKKIKPEDYKISAAELDNYYPAASARGKEDEDFLNHAREITAKLQNGHAGYNAIYDIFLKVSLDMMDSIIKKLNMMPFDKTLGERNASQNLANLEKILNDKKLLEDSEGAKIVNIRRETDTEPMPPFMFYNSRGADTYEATDLAAILYRKTNDNPDKIWYLTDSRQQLHFKQVFRVAEMLDLYPIENLEHLYFGTINGPGGQPFKTRDGNVAGLTDIIEMVNNAVRARITESEKNLDDKTVEAIALAALKFNDLIHDVKSDYTFDPASVTSFEGRTGPYILYTAVRLNSVLKKSDTKIKNKSMVDITSDERNLLVGILDFERTVQGAFDNRATDILANYAYDLCQLINTFYHNCPILHEDVKADIRAQRLYIAKIAFNTLSSVISLMGLNIPDKM
ncbi:MAG: arginine--tRNA ligase [Alphaproteobacteria bacterium]|nr:arginine--tRNA ligase [Alphaproteobacteria bacterium]MBN2674966.1 arginine--tRNA ligase [Alphaproteobacteria bacterium]